MNSFFGTKPTMLHCLEVEGDLAIGLRLLCLQRFNKAATLQVVVGKASVTPVLAANVSGPTVTCLVLDTPWDTAVFTTLCSATFAAAQMMGITVGVCVDPVAVLTLEIREARLSFAWSPRSNATTVSATRSTILVVVAVPAVGC
jgi:hypothetical protein